MRVSWYAQKTAMRPPTPERRESPSPRAGGAPGGLVMSRTAPKTSGAMALALKPSRDRKAKADPR
jgi:hypothetical protein